MLGGLADMKNGNKRLMRSSITDEDKRGKREAAMRQ